MSVYFTKLRPTLKLISFLAFLTVGAGAASPTRWTYSIKPSRPSPGNTVCVLITGPGPVQKPASHFEGQALAAYPAGKGRWKILLGIPANLPPGPHTLHVESGAGSPENLTFEVRPGIFPSESLTFTPEKQKLLSAGPAEGRKIHELMRTETPERRWKGRFSLPIHGRLLTGYGTRRNYEDYHRGVDIKSTQGSLIRAPEAGRVVLAQGLQLHGNTLLIDHGQGVTSVYLHLSKFLVREGEEVRKNQTIGRVGTTGLSTAPHLHWGIYVHGVPVDPMDWTRKKF